MVFSSDGTMAMVNDMLTEIDMGQRKGMRGYW
jgi:hypothetical protein